MARTALTSGAQSTVPATGKNVTDMTVDTLATGAGNGVEVPYTQGAHLLLQNDTGGSAAFTVKVPTPTGMDARGITVPDITITVAVGKDWLYPLDGILRQTGDLVYVDCDVAGKVGLLQA